MKIALWQYYIAVQDNHVFALAVLYTIVACLAGAAVGLDVVSEVQNVSITADHILARRSGAILNHQHLKKMRQVTFGAMMLTSLRVVKALLTRKQHVQKVITRLELKSINPLLRMPIENLVHQRAI